MAAPTSTCCRTPATSSTSRSRTATRAPASRLFPTTPLRNLSGRYFARVAVPGALPNTVDVVNKGDVPQTVQHVTLTDDVQASASTTHDRRLRLAARHRYVQRQTLSGSALTLPQYSDQALGANGQTDITTDAPPATVTLKSSHGGETTVPVVIDGQGLAPTQLIAAAGGDQTVNQGATVTLDGSGSSGNIDSYQWIRRPASPSRAPTRPSAEIASARPAPSTVSASRSGVPGLTKLAPGRCRPMNSISIWLVLAVP